MQIRRESDIDKAIFSLVAGNAIDMLNKGVATIESISMPAQLNGFLNAVAEASLLNYQNGLKRDIGENEFEEIIHDLGGDIEDDEIENNLGGLGKIRADRAVLNVQLIEIATNLQLRGIAFPWDMDYGTTMQMSDRDVKSKRRVRNANNWVINGQKLIEAFDLHKDLSTVTLIKFKKRKKKGFFSKLWKGIKKVAKKIGAVVKKVAPLALAGAAIWFGAPLIGGMLSKGLTAIKTVGSSVMTKLFGPRKPPGSTPIDSPLIADAATKVSQAMAAQTTTPFTTKGVLDLVGSVVQFKQQQAINDIQLMRAQQGLPPLPTAPPQFDHPAGQAPTQTQFPQLPAGVDPRMVDISRQFIQPFPGPATPQAPIIIQQPGQQAQAPIIIQQPGQQDLPAPAEDKVTTFKTIAMIGVPLLIAFFAR